MIVALGSTRGAPGVSAWSMLLAAAWPVDSGLERVVLEADPDGGVAGARYAVGVEPGAQVLVSDLRHVTDPSTALTAAGRRLGEGAWLVPGPESAETAWRLWSAERAAAAVASSLAHDRRRVWLCDLGRVSPRSPTLSFLNEAAITLLLCRDQPADLVQVPARVHALRDQTLEVGVVVVGSPAYDRGELSSFFGCRQVWVAPHDSDLVEMSRQVWSNRRVRRSSVWQAALSVAADVSEPVMILAGLGARGRA